MEKIKFYSDASTVTYVVDVQEQWLYSEICKVFLQDFSEQDIKNHGKEIMEQFIYELSVDNINWLIED